MGEMASSLRDPFLQQNEFAREEEGVKKKTCVTYLFCWDKKKN